MAYSLSIGTYTSVTLNDLERRNSSISPNSIALQANYVTVVEDSVCRISSCISGHNWPIVQRGLPATAELYLSNLTTSQHAAKLGWLAFSDLRVNTLVIKTMRHAKGGSTMRLNRSHLWVKGHQILANEGDHPQKFKQDAQLSQRDRAAGCVIVFAKSRRLELGDNILRTL